jgi:predicted Rossmann-fold nucleotide-binding protein
MIVEIMSQGRDWVEYSRLRYIAKQLIRILLLGGNTGAMGAANETG